MNRPWVAQLLHLEHQRRRRAWRRRLRPRGRLETVGEIVDFENTFLLYYVRGPEGLIVELAERLDGAPGLTRGVATLL